MFVSTSECDGHNIFGFKFITIKTLIQKLNKDIEENPSEEVKQYLRLTLQQIKEAIGDSN
jgi:uncharacterized protein (DUF433 family)